MQMAAPRSALLLVFIVCLHWPEIVDFLLPCYVQEVRAPRRRLLGFVRLMNGAVSNRGMDPSRGFALNIRRAKNMSPMNFWRNPISFRASLAERPLRADTSPARLIALASDSPF
jgi:hypothetical protein